MIQRADGTMLIEYDKTRATKARHKNYVQILLEFYSKSEQMEEERHRGGGKREREKEKSTSVHEVPRDSESGGDNGDSGEDMLRVSTVQVMVYLRSEPSSAYSPAAAAAAGGLCSHFYWSQPLHAVVPLSLSLSISIGSSFLVSETHYGVTCYFKIGL